MVALHPAVTAPLHDTVTARLSLRRLGVEDLGELATVLDDPRVWQFEQQQGLGREETGAFFDRQARLWTDNGFGGCAVRLREQDDFLGVVGLGVPATAHPSVPAVTVGWRLSPTAWGHGYATEAATALLDQAFSTMGLDRVGCLTHPGNRRSVAVAERLGMTRLGEIELPRDEGTQAVSAAVFEVRREVWLSRG